MDWQWRAKDAREMSWTRSQLAAEANMQRLNVACTRTPRARTSWWAAARASARTGGYEVTIRSRRRRNSVLRGVQGCICVAGKLRALLLLNTTMAAHPPTCAIQQHDEPLAHWRRGRTHAAGRSFEYHFARSFGLSCRLFLSSLLGRKHGDAFSLRLRALHALVLALFTQMRHRNLCGVVHHFDRTPQG
mmetsp:Transcript_8196/g.16120  ORF Transcript_8196/g.16120 Transcript_8196/m.16120 type:complete len:189 (+) Transcript_8196:191-757(+)